MGDHTSHPERDRPAELRIPDTLDSMTVASLPRICRSRSTTPVRTTQNLSARGPRIDRSNGGLVSFGGGLA